MRLDAARRYLVGVAVAAVLLRLLGPAWRTGFPSPFPDSSSYAAVADSGPFSPRFWFDERPPVYPLLIWSVGPSARAVVVAQSLLAALAWLWLCATVWQSLRSRWVAGFAVVGLVLTAIQTRWVLWNTAVLTESLSATLAVAGVAAWWRWFDEPSRFRAVTATSIVLAWMLVRDSNAVALLVVSVPALGTVAWMRRRRDSDRRRGMAIALGVLAAAGLYSAAAQAATDRGETSFHNNMGLRWLPDADMRAWMEDRGLPVDEALLARTGKDAWADGEAFLRAPELATYREWADGRGRVAAAASFVVRGDWYLTRMGDELGGYVATDHLAYDSFDVADHLPERPLGPLDPVGSPRALAVWAVAVVAAVATLWVRRRTAAWFALFLAVPVAVDLHLSYVADAVEVGRHLVGPFVRFSVVATVVVALGADEIAAWMRARAANGAADG